MQSDRKIYLVEVLDSWKTIADEQFKDLLERISLSEFEKGKLRYLINRVKAFEAPKSVATAANDDVPF